MTVETREIAKKIVADRIGVSVAELGDGYGYAGMIDDITAALDAQAAACAERMEAFREQCAGVADDVAEYSRQHPDDKLVHRFTAVDIAYAIRALPLSSTGTTDNDCLGS